jgi:hypothetical protein
MRRTEELRKVLDAVRDEIIRLPGFTSCGIGLAREAIHRPGLSPEAVQPEDLVITVTFSSTDHLEQARGTIHRLLPDAPLELGVRGIYRPL